MILTLTVIEFKIGMQSKLLFSEKMVQMLSVFRRAPIKPRNRSLLLQGGCYFSSAPDSLVLQVIIYDADPVEWKVLETLRDLVFAGNHLSP